MSARVMGAVMSCGPAKLRHRMALVAIADAADDFGFAVLSIETIAAKSVCDRRTAMRVVQALERDSWMRVERRVTDGKGSVYFIDVARLGVVADEKSRKSPMHLDFERKRKERKPAAKPQESGDKMSRDAAGASYPRANTTSVKTSGGAAASKPRSGDKLSPENFFLPEDSGDNSQGVQVTIHRGSGDKTAGPFNSFNPDPPLNPNNSPLPPSRGVNALPALSLVEWRQAWHCVKREVRDGLRNTADSLGPKRPAHLADGDEEWKRCFDELEVVRWETRAGGDVRLVLECSRPDDARFGLEKYRKRVSKAMLANLGREVALSVQARAGP